jgi:eukaryotic-like serine/threonine-protein kinase
MDCPACHQANVDGARFCAKCGALLPLPATESDDSLVGQIIGGRFRITQILGEGGMGRVYLAEQQMGTNVRKVAVKTLQAQFAKDQQVLARFHRECGTVSELEHPNTIHFFDFGQTPDGQLYIAMEFVQGQSLSDALRQGPMPPERVLRIMGQVCGSLEEAHSRGVVHRDLKPDNVILTVRAGQSDFVKVLDFGIAKRSEAKDQAQEQKLTQQGMVLGTPPYMSPEQFTGKELDLRSDIYSLGVMAYEMLTGRLPFDADTPWQWATQHMTAQPFPFETMPNAAAIPGPMKQGILRSLAKDREQRQANVRQFYDELAGSSTGSMAARPEPSAPAGRGGTAAMSAPDLAALGGAVAATSTPAYAAAAPVAHPTPSGGQTFPTAPQPGAGAAPARGGKGLIIGLASAAGILGIIGVIMVARSMRPKEEVTVTNPFGTASGAVTVTQVPPEKVDPAATAVGTVEDPSKLAGTQSRPKTGPTAEKSAAPPPPTLKGDAACTEARRLADNGDAAAAARMFAGCDGPQAATTRATIARKAPTQVKQKIFNGDCAGARATLAAVSAIGASGGAESVLAAAPQCKNK